MPILPPFPLQKWIDENRHLLQPPVGAKIIYDDASFCVMIVGGPNRRTDYHVNETDEFFYQLKGDMVLKIVNTVKNADGSTKDEFQDVPIKEGEIFLLPGNTPHSPQRFPDTVGLVIEQKRQPHNIDRLRWYCDNPTCRSLIFEESFPVPSLDLGAMLKPIIEQFYSDEKLRTCSKCGTISQPPQQQQNTNNNNNTNNTQ